MVNKDEYIYIYILLLPHHHHTVTTGAFNNIWHYGSRTRRYINSEIELLQSKRRSSLRCQEFVVFSHWITPAGGPCPD